MKGLFQAPQEMVHSYIKSLGYTSNDFSNDFRNWIKGLTSLPTGSNGDMLSQYLASLGYTGSLSDKITRWLEVSTLSVGRPQTDQNYFSGVMSQLIALGGLTFFKDYRAGVTPLDADYSVGSPTKDYTAARSASAPATYVDANGVVQLLTTSGARRRSGGYYDETGFHAQRGEMIEAAGTNLVQDSYFLDGSISYWVVIEGTSLAKSSDYVNIFGGGQVMKFVGAAANNRFVSDSSKSFSLTSGAKYTASVLVRGSGTIKFRFVDGAGAASFGSNTHTLSDKWTLFTETFTSAETGTSGQIGLAQSGATNVTVYCSYFQFEANPYATSYVPTTTAALQRPAEVLKYETAGNRTAAEETILIKFAPGSTFETGDIRVLEMTETKVRLTFKFSSQAKFQLYPNSTDDPAASVITTTTIPQINTSYVIGSRVADTGDPNSSIYINGASEGTNNTDFTPNAWGTYFFLGSDNVGVNQINGIIQAVAIYNRALSAAEILAATNILNSGGV